MTINSFTKDNAFLSNFAPCRVTLAGHGLVYRSVEQAYVAAKTLDLDKRHEVLLMSGGQAKRWGRMLTLRLDWDDVRLPIMLDLVRQKFKDPDLAALLLATGAQQLVEGNFWGDTFWGVCRGVGENHLGKILMQVRKEIS
jgi:N-glycosidase YbiA